MFLFLAPLIILGAEWQEPTCDPPGCNVTAPLNQGSTSQFKTGGLHIGNAPLGGYQFSVQNGQSYFSQDLEVGDFLDITASNGNIATEGNITLQQGGSLLINDSGVLTVGVGLTLNGDTGVGNNISIITADSGSSINVRNDNNDPNSVSISAGIRNGTAIYGETGEGIGIHGKSTGNGGIGVVGEAGDAATIAGRFDGGVRFNSNSGSDYTEIDGGQVVFQSERALEINPASRPGGMHAQGDVKIEGNTSIDGELTLTTGSLTVNVGLIDVVNDKIINLEYPTEGTDAANKKYVDDQIGGAAIWQHGTGNEIYYDESGGNVGIGTNDPGDKLTIDSGGTSPSAGMSMLRTIAGIGDSRLVYSADGTNNYGLYVDMYSAATNYAAAFMNGNVGIGTDSPTSDLHVYSTGSSSGQTDINLEYDFTDTPNGSQSSDWILRAASVGGSFRILDSHGGAQYERLTIDSTGDVGIGTTAPSPDLKLDVEGKIGAVEYCDEDGINCVPAGGDDLGSHVANQILNMNYHKIINLSSPSSVTDAANKGYVDTAVLAGGDNLGDHTATEDLEMGINSLIFGQVDPAYIKQGTSQGSLIMNNDWGPIKVGIGVEDPSVALDISGGIEVSDIITGTDLNIDNIMLNNDIDVDGSVKTDNITGYSSASSQIEFDSSGNIIITIP